MSKNDIDWEFIDRAYEAVKQFMKEYSELLRMQESNDIFNKIYSTAKWIPFNNRVYISSIYHDSPYYNAEKDNDKNTLRLLVYVKGLADNEKFWWVTQEAVNIAFDIIEKLFFFEVDRGDFKITYSNTVSKRIKESAETKPSVILEIGIRCEYLDSYNVNDPYIISDIVRIAIENYKEGKKFNIYNANTVLSCWEDVMRRVNVGVEGYETADGDTGIKNAYTLMNAVTSLMKHRMKPIIDKVEGKDGMD